MGSSLLAVSQIKGLKVTITELKKEREQYNESKGLHKRNTDVETQTTDQKQYLRKECV